MIKHAKMRFMIGTCLDVKGLLNPSNAALEVLATLRDLALICSFLEVVPWNLGIRLNVVSVNIVRSAFCNTGIVDKAYLVILVMERMG